MNRRNKILLATTLGLIGLTGLLLGNLRTHQRLGAPGVKTSPIPGSVRLRVELPERVLDYQSEWVEVGEVVTKALPADTSFGKRQYEAPDGFHTLMDVVLMGSDRTSLHKPQICLRGSGWAIEKTQPEVVPGAGLGGGDLPVMKLTLAPERAGDFGGMRGLYVYWFVADQASTRDHWKRMWWMFTNLMRTGTLQRWAYVYCFSACPPGQEDATFERMKKFIAAAGPQFQFPERGKQVSAAR